MSCNHQWQATSATHIKCMRCGESKAVPSKPAQPDHEKLDPDLARMRHALKAIKTEAQFQRPGFAVRIHDLARMALAASST